LYEEVEEGSEGEDIGPLKARMGELGHPHDDEENERRIFLSQELSDYELKDWRK